MRGNGRSTSTLDQPAQPLEQRLVEVEDRLHPRKRQLDVDLRELGLAIGPQVFVAEAAHDLEVAVEARHHQDLLEQLRRLREGVELAAVDARRHEVVPRPFGGGARQEGGLDLEEALLVHVAADFHRHAVAKAQVLLQARTPQVQVAVPQPRILHGRRVVLDHERWCLRLGEHADLASDDLDPARGHAGVDRLLGAQCHLADDLEHELAAHPLRRRVGLGKRLGSGHDLADALAVAEADEDHAPEVAAGRRPTHQRDRLAYVVLSDQPAVVGPVQPRKRRRRPPIGHSPATPSLLHSSAATWPSPSDSWVEAAMSRTDQTPAASSSSPRMAT